MVDMTNKLIESLNEDAFFIKKYQDKGITLIINMQTGKRNVILEPRANDESFTRNIYNTIDELKKLNYGGKMTFLAPTSKNNVHWVLSIVEVSLNTREFSWQEVDSLKNGRQNDGFSCGIHTMETIFEIILKDTYANVLEERNQPKPLLVNISEDDCSILSESEQSNSLPVKRSPSTYNTKPDDLNKAIISFTSSDESEMQTLEPKKPTTKLSAKVSLEDIYHEQADKERNQEQQNSKPVKRKVSKYLKDSNKNLNSYGRTL